MLKYIIKRLLWMIPIMLGVIIIVFSLMYITPGDTATILLGDSATPQSVAALNKKLGLDQPYVVQLFNYIKGIVLHVSLGTSYRTKQPVLNEILARFPNTLKLAALAIVLATIIGIVTGIISAVKQYKAADRIATGVALFGVSMPPFWLGLLLILVFSVQLNWLPSAGVATWKNWILPTITLGTAVAGIIMRMTRSSMLDVIRQDYIRTARAKGQREFVVIMKHEFRNALIPIVTIIGVQFGTLMAGAVLCENIFSISGIGKFLVDSINNKDYPCVMGTVLFVAALCTIINLIVDILYTFIDPRIKSVYKIRKRGADNG
ncbi:MAG: ABC transporter permease [Intestinimonas sp.]|nr:ABC transporter permease [Intestinimonas sp.]